MASITTGKWWCTCEAMGSCRRQAGDFRLSHLLGLAAGRSKRITFVSAIVPLAVRDGMGKELDSSEK
jgi:hypothetical protein